MRNRATVIGTWLVAAAALAGGLALGRRTVSKLIKQRLPAEIEAAKTIASAELDKQIGAFIGERLLSFLVSISIKAGFVGAFYLLHAYEHLTATGLKLVISVMLAMFVIRDGLKTIPYVAPALRHIRRNGWNPKQALKKLVAGVAFERAYANALLASQTGPNRFWIALSNYSAHSISVEVAEAVSDIARTTSLRRARWRIATALVVALVTFAIYSALLFSAIGAD
ncbi:MAG: hypothetical protein VX640_10955 [Pseudomonadota bacterium]|nr:hypothetical protein [Pseudomonadota bacterium]